MKSTVKILFLALAAALAGNTMVSCSDDDLGPTIFQIPDETLDRSLATFPLDTFVKVNFLEPYNLRYIYKMEDIGSDLQKNLVPASYDQSVKLAVLSKYLWYDVYAKCAGEEFLKEYSPRIIHVIGSPSYNPTSGTETLGEAEGGLKITLYNTNNLNEENIDSLNEKFFKTMHHEFSHILNQNYVYPTAFPLLSQSTYNPIDWQHTPDSLAAAQGFVSSYASSQAREDWVEVIANYIVKDKKTWDGLLNTAGYDWETVDMDAPKFKALEAKVNAGTANRDSIGYFYEVSANEGSDESEQQWTIQRKVIARNADGTAAVDAEGNIQYLEQDGIDGRNLIEQKLEMTREWLKTSFGIDLDALRDEVQRRQWVTDADGNFVFDAGGGYINRLTAPLESDPSKTLMQSLVDEVEKYKALQTTNEQQ